MDDVRVTQSMLTNNMLRNISSSYRELGKLQDQLATQKKITRPSDDPVVAMLGLGYRTDLNQVEQFSRNISEVENWLHTTDDALTQGSQVLHRIRELIVQASNDTYEENQREAIAEELKELNEQLKIIAQTKIGDKYLFNGTNTSQSPVQVTGGVEQIEFSDGAINIEIFSGIFIQTNVNGQDVFVDEDGNTTFALIDEIVSKLNSGATGEEINDYLSEIDGELDRFLKVQAEVGAKQNRIELMASRLQQQEVTAKKIMSDNEDVNIEKVITELITQESIHRAALAVGARIIQPTLLDFLR